MTLRGRIKTSAVGPTQTAHRWLTRLLQRLTPEAQPRRWSNREIERVGSTVTGDVVHVSAWLDDDKHGRKYREYFPAARSYVTTNVGGERGEGEGDIRLDLAEPLDPQLSGAFDLVLNHTTLEHIYDVDLAFTNLFEMTRSDLLVVVPFMQVEHWEAPSFGDYWRIGAHGLAQACIAHGFNVISLSSNHNPVWPIYYFLHARRADENAEAYGGDLWSVTDTPPGFGFRPVSADHPLMQ